MNQENPSDFIIPKRRPDRSKFQDGIVRALKKGNEKLSEMYLGALTVQLNKNNPERIIQAAHSVRELIRNLPRYWEGAYITSSNTNYGLKNEVKNILPYWASLIDEIDISDREWNDENKRRIQSFLSRLNAFFIKFTSNRPDVRKEVKIILDQIAPFQNILPEQELIKRNEQRIKTWLDFKDYFNGVSKHSDDTQNFRIQFKQFEEFIFNQILFKIHPVVLEDLNDLDRLISEGEKDD